MTEEEIRADERGRIAAAIEAADGTPAEAWRDSRAVTQRTQSYLDGFSDGLAEAVDIARRWRSE